MAKEMTRFSQLNVMYQAGLAILGQANMRPQQVLSLLQ
jgi:flagellin-like hook-associated protein FlgL